MNPAHVNWLAVLVSGALTFIIGGLWYSPVLFGQAWQRLTGLDDRALKQHVARAFGGAALCALVAATNLAFFLGPTATVTFGAAAGAAAGLGWVGTGLATTFLFERRPVALIAIDAGYHAVSYTLMGVILGAWH